MSHVSQMANLPKCPKCPKCTKCPMCPKCPNYSMCTKCTMCLKWHKCPMWPKCPMCPKCIMCPKCPKCPMCPECFMCPKYSMCPKYRKALQIMIENISAMANINHMGGQSHYHVYYHYVITKSIDTTSISYQPLCCGMGNPSFVLCRVLLGRNSDKTESLVSECLCEHCHNERGVSVRLITNKASVDLTKMISPPPCLPLSVSQSIWKKVRHHIKAMQVTPCSWQKPNDLAYASPHRCEHFLKAWAPPDTSTLVQHCTNIMRVFCVHRAVWKWGAVYRTCCPGVTLADTAHAEKGSQIAELCNQQRGDGLQQSGERFVVSALNWIWK